MKEKTPKDLWNDDLDKFLHELDVSGALYVWKAPMFGKGHLIFGKEVVGSAHYVGGGGGKCVGVGMNPFLSRKVCFCYWSRFLPARMLRRGRKRTRPPEPRLWLRKRGKPPRRV